MKFKLSTFSVLIIFSCFSVIGLALIPLLSVQLTPSKPTTSLSVNYNWNNASAKVIEQEVTAKLEGVFNTVKGIERITSTSKKGGGGIGLHFKKNTDMDAIRFEVSNLIRQTYDDFPEGVSYPQIAIRRQVGPDQIEKPILSYSINASESPYYIKKYVEKQVAPEISKIAGVSQVNVYGATAYEWVIKYNIDELLNLKHKCDVTE